MRDAEARLPGVGFDVVLIFYVRPERSAPVAVGRFGAHETGGRIEDVLVVLAQFVERLRVVGLAQKLGHGAGAPVVVGTFRALLPQGRYTVRQGATRGRLTALSGGSFDLELRREKVFDFKVTIEAEGSGDVVVRVSARGAGRHLLSLRSDNLVVKDAEQQTVELKPEDSREVIWHAHIASAETPWVAVVIPDDRLSDRIEVTGTATLQIRP